MRESYGVIGVLLYIRYGKCMGTQGGHIYEVVIISDPNWFSLLNECDCNVSWTPRLSSLKAFRCSPWEFSYVEDYDGHFNRYDASRFTYFSKSGKIKSIKIILLLLVSFDPQFILLSSNLPFRHFHRFSQILSKLSI